MGSQRQVDRSTLVMRTERGIDDFLDLDPDGKVRLEATVLVDGVDETEDADGLLGVDIEQIGWVGLAERVASHWQVTDRLLISAHKPDRGSGVVAEEDVL